MTISEVRQSREYVKMLDKIKNYSTGFVFELNYASIPRSQANALKIVMKDCIDMGILESVSFDLDFDGNCTYEKFKKR